METFGSWWMWAAFAVFVAVACAIVLRAMYFPLAELKDRFHLLTYGQGLIRVFVGSKIRVVDRVNIPVFWSPGIFGSILAMPAVASLVVAPRPVKA